MSGLKVFSCSLMVFRIHKKPGWDAAFYYCGPPRRQKNLIFVFEDLALCKVESRSPLWINSEMAFLACRELGNTSLRSMQHCIAISKVIANHAMSNIPRILCWPAILGNPYFGL